MTPKTQPGDSGAFEAIVASWLELDGVTAAALASTDGLLIASAGVYGQDIEALVANCATVMAAAAGVSETAEGRLKVITIETDSRGVILAPLGRELFLIIAGEATLLPLAGGHGIYGLALRRR